MKIYCLIHGAWSAYCALCTAAQTQLNAALTANGLEEVTITPESYGAVLTDLLSRLVAVTGYEQAYREALQELTAKVAQLKGQLDSYGAFYQGILEYTAGLSKAASGANALQSGLTSLCTNTDALKASVAQLNTAAGDLSEGAAQVDNGVIELKNGAEELKDRSKKLLRLFGL